jgi:peptidoglycan/LPS O-acetylase OafA/YrhL
MTRDRQPGLDTLRALAILLVFAYHYRVFVSGENTFGWASAVGWTGVDLFFVLSGYLIANQLFGGLLQGRTLSFGAFYARRALRTLPNFWVVLALYFLFPAVMGGREPPPLWRFLTFTQNIELQPGTAFSHAWSLCIEEQFYLGLPLALWGVTRLRHQRALAWALIGALVLAAIAWRTALWLQYGRESGGAIARYYPTVYYGSLSRLDEFLPGVALALLKNGHPQAWARITQHGKALFALGLAATLAMLWGLMNFYEIDGYGYGYLMSGFGYSLMAMAWALLLLGALGRGSPLQRWRVPGAASLALWSYALYLTHKPIAFIVNRQLKPWALPAPLVVAAVSAACLLGGWLLFRLVETPFMRWRDRWVPRQFDAGEMASRIAPAGAGTRSP